MQQDGGSVARASHSKKDGVQSKREEKVEVLKKKDSSSERGKQSSSSESRSE